jgi:hypothetical protein
VVPSGSLQAENGLDWIVRHGSNALAGTSTRLRFGVAHCTEFLIDVPNYFGSLNGSPPSGFSDVVVSFKRQLPVPFGFDLSATAGLGFPSGSNISGQGYQPYIQFPWSHTVADGWEVVGMFTLIWFPSESRRDPTFEPTLSLEREFGSSADLFLEYVGDYDHHRPTQVYRLRWCLAIHQNTAARFSCRLRAEQQSVGHYFGIGYSFRLDGLFASSVGYSP